MLGQDFQVQHKSLSTLVGSSPGLLITNPVESKSLYHYSRSDCTNPQLHFSLRRAQMLEVSEMGGRAAVQNNILLPKYFGKGVSMSFFKVELKTDFDSLDKYFVLNVSFAQLEWKLRKFYQNDIENVPIINFVVKGTCENVMFVVGSQRADLA